MNSSEIININLIITDRIYPLKIKSSEEEMVRNAAKIINEKIKGFQDLYDGKDKQDYLVMCLLNYVIDSISKTEPNTAPAASNDMIEEKLNTLNNMLSNYIEKINT